VTRDKARGKVIYTMTPSSTREQPARAAASCGQKRLNFTAKRGVKHPGLLTPPPD
jgi:hypothetical protein